MFVSMYPGHGERRPEDRGHYIQLSVTGSTSRDPIHATRARHRARYRLQVSFRHELGRTMVAGRCGELEDGLMDGELNRKLDN